MNKLTAIVISAMLMFPVISFADDTTTMTTTPVVTPDTTVPATPSAMPTSTMTPTAMSGGGALLEMTVDQKIQLHKDIIQVHQSAIDCLQANKPQMECAKNFKAGMEQVRMKYFPNVKKGLFDQGQNMMMQQQ